MDKKQALEEGLKLWNILAITGGSEKKDVPGPWQRYLNHCPCCEYVKGECIFCPIMWVFQCDDCGNSCCDSGSPYRAWMKAKTVENRRFFARRVMCLHGEALGEV